MLLLLKHLCENEGKWYTKNHLGNSLWLRKVKLMLRIYRCIHIIFWSVKLCNRKNLAHKCGSLKPRCTVDIKQIHFKHTTNPILCLTHEIRCLALLTSRPVSIKLLSMSNGHPGYPSGCEISLRRKWKVCTPWVSKATQHQTHKGFETSAKHKQSTWLLQQMSIKEYSGFKNSLTKSTHNFDYRKHRPNFDWLVFYEKKRK